MFKNYFRRFYSKQTQRVKNKIGWTLRLLATIQDVPADYLKHLTGTDGLYEVRIKVGSDIYRVFCFFDEGKLVVLANGFQKKSQKPPPSEIERALKIKKEYENEKK